MESAMERLRLRLDSWTSRYARYVVAVDGGLVVIVGIYAIIGALDTFQGEGFLLVVAGIALILFGLMMIVGWNLAAVRTGLDRLDRRLLRSIADRVPGRHGSVRHRCNPRPLRRPRCGWPALARLPGTPLAGDAALRLHRVRARGQAEGLAGPEEGPTSVTMKRPYSTPCESRSRPRAEDADRIAAADL